MFVDPFNSVYSPGQREAYRGASAVQEVYIPILAWLLRKYVEQGAKMVRTTHSNEVS